jgi:hypothetical protein
MYIKDNKKNTLSVGGRERRNVRKARFAARKRN